MSIHQVRWYLPGYMPYYTDSIDNRIINQYGVCKNG
nr:MAG TPA: hypothetical protein [Caudoviricetes sp.]